MAGAIQNFDYTTSSGANVDIRLYGVGTLSGTYVDANGALNIRYSGTNSQTGIIGTVVGGTGRAQLKSVLPLNVPAQSLSGVGESLVDIVNLKDFDLLPGGQINLTGGVHALMLNSVGADTQINVRELPESLSNSTLTLGSTTSSSTSSASAVSSSSSGTVTPSPSLTSTQGSVAITVPPFPAPSNGSFTQSGVTTTYSLSYTGANVDECVGRLFGNGDRSEYRHGRTLESAPTRPKRRRAW